MPARWQSLSCSAYCPRFELRCCTPCRCFVMSKAGTVQKAENCIMLDSVPLLTAINLHKTYRKDAVEVPVLRGLDLEVHLGEFLAIVGASGCGKSTLLHLLGTI